MSLDRELVSFRLTKMLQHAETDGERAEAYRAAYLTLQDHCHPPAVPVIRREDAHCATCRHAHPNGEHFLCKQIIDDGHIDGTHVTHVDRHMWCPSWTPKH